MSERCRSPPARMGRAARRDRQRDRRHRRTGSLPRLSDAQ
jgi:hypothetical protein